MKNGIDWGQLSRDEVFIATMGYAGAFATKAAKAIEEGCDPTEIVARAVANAVLGTIDTLQVQSGRYARVFSSGAPQYTAAIQGGIGAAAALEACKEASSTILADAMDRALLKSMGEQRFRGKN